jgi:hypothetical protein
MMYNSKTPLPTKLAITHHDISITIEIPWDSDFDTFMTAIEGMFVSIGYSKNTFNEWVKNYQIETNNSTTDNDQNNDY